MKSSFVFNAYHYGMKELQEHCRLPPRFDFTACKILSRRALSEHGEEEQRAMLHRLIKFQIRDDYYGCNVTC